MRRDRTISKVVSACLIMLSLEGCAYVDLDCVCGLTASAAVRLPCVSVMTVIHSARVCLLVFV